MRELADSEGLVWSVAIASPGRTSGYLNRRVHRPIVQFTCKTVRRARRYAPLPGGHDSLESLKEEELGALLEKARSY